jgi:hypothetical protein
MAWRVRETPSKDRSFTFVLAAIERLHDEFKRRIKTQTALPNAETAAKLFCALLASGRSRYERSTAGKVSRKSRPPRSLTFATAPIGISQSSHHTRGAVAQALCRPAELPRHLRQSLHRSRDCSTTRAGGCEYAR